MVDKTIAHYRMITELGRGGMGMVYKARDTHLDRFVAIKILRPDKLENPDRRQRFVHEAKAASALNHPNIVHVYDIADANGIQYIAMEFVPGQTLNQLIGRRGLRLDEALRYAIQIADALATAHSAGIVHRDLKPSNVMVNGSGVVKLLDFGVAKLTDQFSSVLDETASLTGRQERNAPDGAIIGTFAYMAPEQAEGKDVDARADIFSFGCVLYEMVTGHRAFSAVSTLSTIAKVLREEPPPIRQLAPTVPRRLERIICGCLRKDPNERWQSAVDLRMILDDLQSDSKATNGQGKPRPRSRRRLLVAGAAFVAALAAGSWWYLHPPAHREPVARITALTKDGGLSGSPSLSRDGSLLAFSSDRAGQGNMDIWLQQIGGRSLMQLTHDPADETDPDILPDGTRIVFRSERDGGGVYTVPALGGEPSLLAPGGRNPRSSPDGTFIAYWVGRTGPKLVADTAKVYVVPSAGGQAQQIGGDLAAAKNPVWTARGDALLVLGRKNRDLNAEPDADWWIVPVDGGGSKPIGALEAFHRERLRVPPWENNINPLCWFGKDPGTILFAAARGDPVNLWSVTVDAVAGKLRKGPVPVTSGTSSEAFASAALIPTGDRIAFSSQSLNFDLWSITADIERGRTSGDFLRLTDDWSSKYYPSLSWDASRVTFTTRDQTTSALRVRDITSGKDTTLLTTSKYVVCPRISGDGQWVSYAILGDIFRVSTHGGTVKQLCKGCGTPTDSSFDGQTLILEPPETPEDVRSLDASTGKVTTLVRASNLPLYDGRLSHDAKWVAFHAQSDDSRSHVFLARADSGRPVEQGDWIPVSDANASYCCPAWSPGGSVLYFLSDRDGFRCIWSRHLDPLSRKPVGEPLAIYHFHHARRSLQKHTNFGQRIGLAVAQNRIVLSVGDLTGNVWMLERPAR